MPHPRTSLASLSVALLLVGACSSTASTPDGGAPDGGAADAGDAGDAGPKGTPAGSNSNACLADLGLLQPACPKDASSGLPNAACCNAFKKFQEDSCGCSPLVKTVMGNDAKGVSQLDTLVNGLNGFCPTFLEIQVPKPNCADPITLSGISSGAAKTYNGGKCELSDAQMDNLRFQSAGIFAGVVKTTSEVPYTGTCVDFKAIVASMAPAFEADSADGKYPYIQVPYGIGRYTTLKSMAEYLSIIFPVVNKAAFRVEVSTVQTPDSMLYFTPDGANIVSGNHGTNRVVNDCVTVADGYYEQTFRFDGCGTKIHGMDVTVNSAAPSQPSKVTVMPALVSNFLDVAGTTTWGPVDICKYHEQHCTGDNQQFPDFAACLDFMKKLPLVSPACASAGKVLGGDSLACRFKHHFMIPYEPATHCFHIGTGKADIHNHKKCVDTECADADVLGGPMNLLRPANAAETACLTAADAPGSTWGVIPSEWPVVTACP